MYHSRTLTSAPSTSVTSFDPTKPTKPRVVCSAGRSSLCRDNLPGHTGRQGYPQFSTRQEGSPSGAPASCSLRVLARWIWPPDGSIHSSVQRDRATPTPHPDRLLRVLSPHTNSPLTRQGCARRQADRAAGVWPRRADPRSRWPASPLRPPGRIVPRLPRRAQRATRRTVPCFPPSPDSHVHRSVAALMIWF